MAKRKIVWSSRAQQEFTKVLAYYTEKNQSVAYSLKLTNTIEHITELLAVNPKMGLENQDNSSRTFIVDNYSIIYEASSEVLTVLSFWDDRQDSSGKLHKKKT
ncbi:type II toxin-antitoxin system RelE/ParE family toxin [Salibacter halophilus]|uniref:Type II toxin-antitoxin system RelE/ParE family toxin n=1 Tax=Salibacter halophilus TaxID=1803916 RepID=A0A6N6MEA3_9FLAO|nr:type II toxin-antitoxin system RelE/ParE family toxin [Salibacter halophilus]KAB1066035.1 type II toxin-antitoxin system RelE/ParE family toxin [Salibacter halophilus]